MKETLRLASELVADTCMSRERFAVLLASVGGTLPTHALRFL